jgi:hypothetical protein
MNTSGVWPPLALTSYVRFLQRVSRVGEREWRELTWARDMIECSSHAENAIQEFGTLRVKTTRVIIPLRRL